MDVPLMLSPVGLEPKRLEEALAEFPFPKQRTPRLSHRGWHKAAGKGRELLLGTPDHMRRLLKSTVFTWI